MSRPAYIGDPPAWYTCGGGLDGHHPQEGRQMTEEFHDEMTVEAVERAL